MDVLKKEPKPGWIEVITGSMFSGKSEELIRRLRRAQIARQKVQVFKPLIDNRFSEGHIVSHSDMRIESRNVRNSDELVECVDEATEVVGIDEGQFFDLRLPAARQTRHRGRPRPGLPRTAVRAGAAAFGYRGIHITKTLAICVVCGGPANHTQRLVPSGDRVLVGATGLYEARCRHCFDAALAAVEKT